MQRERKEGETTLRMFEKSIGEHYFIGLLNNTTYMLSLTHTYFLSHTHINTHARL